MFPVWNATGDIPLGSEFSYITNVKIIAPMAICLVLIQFITIAIIIKLGEFNVIFTAIVYAIIMVIGYGLIYFTSNNGNKAGLFIIILVGIFLLVLFGLVSIILAIPIYIFCSIIQKSKNYLLSTIIYFLLTCLIFVFGLGAICYYFDKIIISIFILIGIAILYLFFVLNEEDVVEVEEETYLITIRRY